MARHTRPLLLGALAASLLMVSSCTQVTSPETNTDPDHVVYPVSNDQIDSLFNVLIERVQLLDELDSYDEFAATDYKSLSRGFGNAVRNKPDNVKGNVGYIVSSVLALNSSSSIKKLVDSLETYYDGLDQYYSSDGFSPGILLKRSASAGRQRLLTSAFAGHGIQGLGFALAARTPELVAAQAQVARPSWPRFVTASYIQGVVDQEIRPVLDSVIAAAQRMEGLAEPTLSFVVDGDTAEVDLGDIYMMEAGMRLLRAYLAMMTAYNYDIYTSATDQSYSWMDLVVDSMEDAGSQTVYRLSGDTLYHIWHYDYSGLNSMVYRIYKYNFGRKDFLTLRSGNHARALADLKTVPDLVKKGLASIRSEKDGQNDDIIPASSIMDMDEEMVDVPQNMMDEGISSSLASNFRSPEALADFVTRVLSGPYAFDETIDGKHYVLTVDISAFFTNPAQDLRTLLPKYRWVDESKWATPELDVYSVSSLPGGQSIFYCTTERSTIAIPPAQIASKTVDGTETKVTLVNKFHYEANADSIVTVEPVALTDDKGAELDIEALIDAKAFFPYFDDYTFHGVFPGMTRQKWLSLIWQ